MTSLRCVDNPWMSSLYPVCSGRKVNTLNYNTRYSYHKDEILRGITSLRHVLVPWSTSLGVTGCLPRKIPKDLSTGASDKGGHEQVLWDFPES